jgi:hypothetical protein
MSVQQHTTFSRRSASPCNLYERKSDEGGPWKILFCRLSGEGVPRGVQHLRERPNSGTELSNEDTPGYIALRTMPLRSKPRTCRYSAYFLSASFSEVHGTFRVMWPSPSVDLRFAVCMSELMSAISNTPSCWAIQTRSPLFGVIMLVPVLIGTSD